MIIEEHKNGEASIRIHDDFLTSIEESLKILEKAGDNLLRNLISPQKTNDEPGNGGRP
ncbi:MAG: hypothetical protein WCD89_02750 [Anaerocolumna sp.]